MAQNRWGGVLRVSRFAKGVLRLEVWLTGLGGLTGVGGLTCWDGLSGFGRWGHRGRFDFYYRQLSS